MKKLFIVALPVVAIGVVFAFYLSNSSPVEHVHAAHHHQTQQVPENALPPEISLQVVKDAMSGFNLTLLLKNYQLMLPAADLAQTTVVDNASLSGHAHLYVNGEKIQRIYGRFIHVPKTLLKAGENTIRVTLNNHNHANWSLDGEVVQSELTLQHSGAVIVGSSEQSSHH